MFHTPAATDMLDMANGAFDRGGRIVVEAKRQSQKEEHFRIGGSLDLPVQRRVDGQHQLSLYILKPRDRAVVHPEPFAMPEGMAVGLLHGGSRRCPDVCKRQPRSNVPREFPEISIIPGWLNAPVKGRHVGFAIPTNTKPIAVRRLGTQS